MTVRSRFLKSKNGNKPQRVWDVVVDQPPQADGKRHRVVRRGFATKSEATAEQATIMTDIKRNRFVKPNKVTVGEYLENWLEEIKPPKTDLRPSTWASYESHVRLYLVPQLGLHRLQRLGMPEVRGLHAFLSEHGLKPATVRRVHATLHRSLSDAMDDQLIHANPASLPLKRLPKVVRPDLKTWTGEELHRFFEHVQGDRLYAAYLLAASTGLRRGEVLGLRWRDLDLAGVAMDDGTVVHSLSVCQTLISLGHKLSISEPKTSGSRRSVELDRATVAVVKAHKVGQGKERLRWGSAYDDHGLVFQRENGQPVHPDRFSKEFKQHVQASKLPMIRLHDLRHTHASLALAAGVPVKVVQERLGHHSAAFTADHYQHVIQGMQRDAAETVANLVWSTSTAEGSE